MTKSINKMRPLHPGEILMYEFVKPLFPKTKGPMGMDVNAIALKIGIHALHFKALLAERVALTAEDAFRLAHYFGTDIDTWLNLQRNYELARLYCGGSPEVIKLITPHPMKDGALVPIAEI